MVNPRRNLVASSLMLLQVLVLIHCCIADATRKQMRPLDLDVIGSVGTLNFNCTELHVFDINGMQFSEPLIQFGATCASPMYNFLYYKFVLTLPIIINVSTMAKSLKEPATVGRVTITEVDVQVNYGLVIGEEPDAAVSALVKLGDSPQLLFVCDTYYGCQNLSDAIQTNPKQIQRAVKFYATGRADGIPVKFGAQSSANSPPFDCHNWVLLQRRDDMDRGFSFERNWDEYVNGFGSADRRYYWMGLDALHVATDLVNRNSTCLLRVEVKDRYGKFYWGEWGNFSVSGPRKSYQLNIGRYLRQENIEDGFRPPRMDDYNNLPFGTQDRYYDTDMQKLTPPEDPRGGWWFKRGLLFNLNISPDVPLYLALYTQTTATQSSTYLTLGSSAMMFKCLG